MRVLRPGNPLLSLGAVLVVAICSPARADLLPSPFLPLSNAEINSFNATIGGTVTCSTDGDYDATTFALALAGNCSSTGLLYDDGTLIPNVMTDASLTGLVDNNGDVIGGTFALTGVIAGLGINVPTLLASGTLIDAEYGVAANNALMMQTLIKLDFVNAALGDVGDLLYWASFATVAGWGPPGTSEWQVTVDPTDFSNFSGSQYFFLDQGLILPEPGSMALFGAGLILLGLRRRRAATLQ